MSASIDALHAHFTSQLNHLKSKLMYKGAGTIMPNDDFRKVLDSAVWRFLKMAENKGSETPGLMEQVRPLLKPSEEIVQSLNEALDQESQSAPISKTPELEQETVQSTIPATPQALQLATAISGLTQTPTQSETIAPSSIQTSQSRPSISGQDEPTTFQPLSISFGPETILVPVRGIGLLPDFDNFVNSLKKLKKFDKEQQDLVYNKAVSYLQMGEVGLAQELMKTIVALARPNEQDGVTPGFSYSDVLSFAQDLLRRPRKWRDINLEVLSRALMEAIIDRNRLKDFAEADPRRFETFMLSFLMEAKGTNEFDSILARFGVINEFKRLREYESAFSRARTEPSLVGDPGVINGIRFITFQRSLNKLEAQLKNQGINVDFSEIQQSLSRRFATASLSKYAQKLLSSSPCVFNDLVTFAQLINNYGFSIRNLSLTNENDRRIITNDMKVFSYLFMLNLPRFFDLGTFIREDERHVALKFMNNPTPENWYSVVNTLLGKLVNSKLLPIMRDAGLEVLPKSPLRSKDSALVRIYENPEAIFDQDLVKFLRESMHEGYIYIPKPLLDKLEGWSRERTGVYSETYPMFRDAAVVYVLAQLHKNGVLFKKFGVTGTRSDEVLSTFSRFLDSILSKSGIYNRNSDLWKVIRSELLQSHSRPYGYPFNLIPPPILSDTLDAFSFLTNQQEFYYQINSILSNQGYTLEALGEKLGQGFIDSYERLKLGVATIEDISVVASEISRFVTLPEDIRNTLDKFNKAVELTPRLFLKYLNQHAFLASVANSRRVLHRLGQITGNKEIAEAGLEMLDLLKEFVTTEDPENTLKLLRLLDGGTVRGQDYVTGKWVIHAVNQYKTKFEARRLLLDKEWERKRQEELERQEQELLRRRTEVPTEQEPPQQPAPSPSQQTAAQKPTGTQAQQPAGGTPAVSFNQQIMTWFNKLSPLGRLALFLGVPLTTAGVILAMFGKPSAFITLLLGLGAVGVGMYYETFGKHNKESK